MIERVKLANTPDEKLLLTFVVQAKPEDADNLLVEFTHYEMRKRLQVQRERGYKGWNTAQCENLYLKKQLLKNAEAGDWLDVVNLAAMLLARTRMFEEVALKDTSF
jgi:hypothetical protein